MSTQAPVIVDAEIPPPFEHILFPRAPIHRGASLLAQFLTELKYEDIPADVLHMAKRLTLDTIGCIVAGTQTTLGGQILTAYSNGTDTGVCTVPGAPQHLSPSVAAKINGWLSDVLDYEDVAAGHPSATVIPAALAMAEHLKASPKRFLAGVVAGYEAGLRVHDATQAGPEAYRRFAVYHAWHGIAAGAAAMTVSGGTEAQFRSALGHAAANTPLPLWYVQYGRPAHALKANYGQMALGGVDAALCARQDILGPFAMLSDEERGFARIIGSDQFDPSQLSAGLAQVWRTRDAALKLFPSCAFLHTTIDAASQIMKDHVIDPDAIDRVRIRCFARIAEWFSDKAPTSPVDAQFSVEYVATMALLSVEPGRDWYSPTQMNDPRVSAMMNRIDVEVDPTAETAFWESDQYISSCDIFTKDGQAFTATVRWAPGTPARPLTDLDVANKFLRNIAGTSVEAHGEEIVEKTMNLEHLNSIDELLNLLQGNA